MAQVAHLIGRAALQVGVPGACRRQTSLRYPAAPPPSGRRFGQRQLEGLARRSAGAPARREALQQLQRCRAAWPSGASTERRVAPLMRTPRACSITQMLVQAAAQMGQAALSSGSKVWRRIKWAGTVASGEVERGLSPQPVLGIDARSEQDASRVVRGQRRPRRPAPDSARRWTMKILLPVDGSQSALDAVRFVIGLARQGLPAMRARQRAGAGDAVRDGGRARCRRAAASAARRAARARARRRRCARPASRRSARWQRRRRAPARRDGRAVRLRHDRDERARHGRAAPGAGRVGVAVGAARIAGAGPDRQPPAEPEAEPTSGPRRRATPGPRRARTVAPPAFELPSSTRCA